MKSAFSTILMVLPLVGSLAMPAQAVQVTVSKAGEIQKISDDLKNEITQMKEFEIKADAARDKLATRILGPDGRQMAQNEVGLDAPTALDYRGEASNDVGWLKEHWKELSPEQRHEVGEAEITLE